MRAPRSFLVLPCICVLALTAAGCGGGGGGAKYSGASPESWAATVCGALTNWAQGLQADSRRLGADVRKAKSIRSVKAKFVVFLERAGTSADTMIERVHGAGPPAVKDGEAIQSELEAGLRQARASFTRAEKRANKLSTSDAQSFSSGVTALGRDIRQELTATGKAFYNLGDKYENEKLNNATSDEPACSTISS